jgi:phosphoesterase RecJ-like protein
MKIKQAVELLKTNDDFLIICHSNPDGDTLGSGYALCEALQIFGKNAKVICDDEPSVRFNFLLVNIKIQEFIPQTIITVDVADIQLLGGLKKQYGDKIDLCIDHHVSNKNYARHTLLDKEAAACAEVVWELIKAMEVKVTPEIASAIYTGVSTDTGCFRYSNTTAKTHRIAAELIEYGFDVQRINYLMFELKTRKRIELEQKAYADMEYYFNNKCAVIILYAGMLKGIDPEDASNISALPKQIEGVEAGVVIKEKESGVYKVSVRTSNKVDAQAVCSILGGGGHIRAAGFTLRNDLDSVKSAVLAEIGRQLGV